LNLEFVYPPFSGNFFSIPWLVAKLSIPTPAAGQTEHVRGVVTSRWWMTVECDGGRPYVGRYLGR